MSEVINLSKEVSKKHLKKTLEGNNPMQMDTMPACVDIEDNVKASTQWLEEILKGEISEK